MGFYDDMQDVAREILTEFAQAGISYIELTSAIGGTPDNPGKPGETMHLLTAAVRRGVDAKYVDGTQVVGSDGQVTFAASSVSFLPKISDFVEVDGKRHKIVKVHILSDPITPAAFVVIYKR